MKKKNKFQKLRLLIFIFGMILFVSCSSDDEPNLSSENKMLSFKIKPNDISFSGKIDHVSKVVRIETIGLEQNNSIIPEVEISKKAKVFPNPSTTQDFNETMKYVITAENGEQVIYTIDPINQPFSIEKNILSFKINIDNEIFIGKIDEKYQVINVICYKDVSNISPEIEVSEYATVSPSPSEKLNFNELVEYIVTAQDGTTKTYKVNVLKQEINSTLKSCYIRATSFARVSFLDLLNEQYELILENESNSYTIEYFDLETWDSNGIPLTNFYFTFNEDIVTSNDYKLKFKINGKIKAETSYLIDVLAENAPKIISANQISYYYKDTLILKGENLLPGLRIPANGNIYSYDQRYIIVNQDQTELSFFMNINQGMFPGGIGQPSPRPTRISIYQNGRYADSIVLDFN